MKRPISLTFRLTLMFSAVATVVFLSFGWMIGQSLEEHFISEDNKELQEIARAVNQSLFDLQTDDEFNHIQQRFADILVGHHSALLRVTNEFGGQIYSSPGFDRATISNNAEIQLKKGGHNYRIIKNKITTRNQVIYHVTIAVATDFHAHYLQSFRYTLWLMVISGIAFMGLMGWISVRHGHRPLHHIVDQISQISTDELNKRLAPESVPSELKEIAISFNDLLQRMEEAFVRLSNFSDDIAHELRTPITNLMTQTQVSLSQTRNAAELEEILYSNIEEYERMAQMIGDMLYLAKADDGLVPLSTEDINLVDEIQNLFDYYEAWAEELNVTLSISGKANVTGDRLMLRRALSNLLSNAIRHTAPTKNVNINLATDKNSVFITIQNPGIPISEKHLNKIFDRFYRVDPSRQRGSEGTGLGLAIVKSIVDAHHGKVSALSDKLLTQFCIQLPK